MPNARVAATMPGKIGDALYSLPFIRELSKEYGPVDFYTSDYCRPLVDLFEYQSCINRAYIATNYRIERMDMGIQPWRMPVPDMYEKVYHCGFQTVPDRSLHQFIAYQHGIYKPLAVEYEFPAISLPKTHYVVLAPRGETSWRNTFMRFIQKCPIPVHVIGAKADYIGAGIDCTGQGLLETLGIISKASAFVGIGSSQLVLANGITGINKIVPHHGYEYDMRHFVYTAENIYLQNPTEDDIIKELGL